MRLTSFLLENYGNFAARPLSFDPDPGCINLVVAPNGTGKSVLRRAFRDLLFGIPSRSEMAFRFGYSGMRLFAEGVDIDGARFAFGRRKGTRNTLIDGAGNSLDPGVLTRLIGDADEALFERLFALDSRLLRSGAEAMLASGGDLAEALFAAGGGIASLCRMRQELDASRDQLAPERRTRSRPFYNALDQLGDALADLRAATIRPKDWEERNAKLAFVRERHTSLIERQGRVRAEMRRLERIKRVRPWLEQLEAVRREIVASGEAPCLLPDAGGRWEDARHQLALAAQENALAKSRLQRIVETLAAERSDCTLLANAGRVDALQRARDQIAADRRDLPRRMAEQARSAERTLNLLTALGLRSYDEIAAILPNGPQVAAARELIREHASSSERLRSAAAAVAKSGREMALAEAELALIGEPEDASGLAALVAEIRKPGDPERLLVDLRARSLREEGRLAAALRKVPLWDRGLDALADVVPPANEMIDRAAAAVEAARAAQRDAEREVGRLDRERGEAIGRAAALRAGTPVPDAAAVAAARAHRDLGWSLIRRNRFEGQLLEAEITGYAEPLGLATAFESAIRDADDLADRRDEESARLAAIAENERAVARLGRAIDAAERGLAAARERHQAALAEWRAMTQPLCLRHPPELEDIKEFLASRDVVLDRYVDCDDARRAVADEERRQQSARLRLADVLPAESCASLPGALMAAQQLIDRCEAVRRHKSRLEATIETLRRRHQEALQEEAEASAARSLWETAWRACLATLGRPPDEMPAAVEKAIEILAEAQGEHRAQQDLKRRIAGMEGNIAGFEAEVAALVDIAVPDQIGRPADLAVEELRRRLQQNRDIEARRSRALDDQREACAKLEAAADRLERATTMLDTVKQEIGGDSDDEIACRIALAARRAAAEEKSAEIAKKLREIGDGLRQDRLEEETAAVDAATRDSELAGLRGEEEEIGNERDLAAREEQQILGELNAIRAAKNALDAASRRQSAIAVATRTSAEALLYHAAACLLRHGIERLRDVGGNGLVKRIGGVFSRITGGAYAGVVADEDENGAPFLVAIEADGKTAKRIPELSDGTQDQLFLALRLVMVEDYSGKAAALPFIADDLLQTFDDYGEGDNPHGRTANALAAFADLSRHVQVIVLTHHRRLAEIAKARLGRAVNICDLAA